MKQCPLCSGKDWKLIYPLGVLRVHKCRACSMMFLNPYLTPGGMAKIFSSPELLTRVSAFFADYCEDKTWITPRTRAAYEKALAECSKTIPIGGKIMDVGCGQGAFLKVAAEHGWRAFGIEPNCGKAAELEKEHGIRIFQKDFFSADIPQSEYDAVSTWDFIEHLPDPAALVRRCGLMLKPGGLLITATPNHFSFLDFSAALAYYFSFGKFTYPLRKLYTVDHTLYFTGATLRALLKKEGFEIAAQIKVNTDLDRYAMGPLFRCFAELLLFKSRLFGLENRIIVIARKKA